MLDFVFNCLKTNGLINEKENIEAKNFMEIGNKDVVISGNKQGLILLAEYLVAIAMSGEDGAHIHLDDLNFFNKTNGELIISKANDVEMQN